MRKTKIMNKKLKKKLKKLDARLRDYDYNSYDDIVIFDVGDFEGVINAYMDLIQFFEDKVVVTNKR